MILKRQNRENAFSTSKDTIETNGKENREIK